MVYVLIVVAVYLLLGIAVVAPGFDRMTVGCTLADKLVLFVVGVLIAAPVTAIFTLNDAAKAAPSFFRQGVSLMKRKLFATLFLMALGGEVLPSIGYQPQLFERAIAWWNAPPAPPSPEAQKLIASLENGEGWMAEKYTNSAGFNFPTVKRGKTAVVICAWHADVYVQGAIANSSFTYAEQRAINNAAERCLRKLTAQALEAAK